MGPDQRAFQETVQIAQHVEAILEGAGFALVAVDGHQPRPGLTEHCAPFAPGREAGAAEPAKARIVERLQDVFLADATGAQVAQQLVAAPLHIGIVVDIGRDIGLGLAALGRRQHFGGGGVQNVVMSNLSYGRNIAQPDAGRAYHAHFGSGALLHLMQQLFRTQHGAGERIADADGQRRNIRLALFDDVEMGIKGRGLEHFRERKLHLVGQRCEMVSRDLMVLVLDQMQMLDQEIAPPRPVAEQELNLVGGGRIDLSALGRRLGPPAPLARMLEGANLMHVMTHGSVSFS